METEIGVKEKVNERVWSSRAMRRLKAVATSKSKRALGSAATTSNHYSVLYTSGKDYDIFTNHTLRNHNSCWT